MNAFLSLGRWLFAIPFAIFGLFHFLGAEGMAGIVPIPGGVIWVYLTGVGLIGAAAAMILGKYDKLACTLLAVMLLAFVGLVHLKGAMASDQMAMISLLKDLALAGAAMMYAESRAKDSSIIG